MTSRSLCATQVQIALCIEATIFEYANIKLFFQFEEEFIQGLVVAMHFIVAWNSEQV